jgi:hypothetical protein
LTLFDKITNQELDVYTETVIVNNLPTVEFSVTQQNAEIPTVDIAETSEELNNWIWKVDGRMVSDRSEFEHTFREKGTHDIELSSTNEFGCENSSTENIEISNDYNLFAPNAFAPNGNGQYDNFMPGALLLEEPEFIMTIYNQDGATVFTTPSAYMPWKGELTDNTEAPGGMYVWTVILKNGNGTKEVYRGQVLLIR